MIIPGVGAGTSCTDRKGVSDGDVSSLIWVGIGGAVGSNVAVISATSMIVLGGPYLGGGGWADGGVGWMMSVLI